MNIVKDPSATLRPTVLAVVAACCAAVLGVGLMATTPCSAASIPAWLDDGISKWNAGNPDTPIRFVDIKDSFVWYDIPRKPDLTHQQIRARLNDIVLGHGYVPMNDEESVTTGKPPVESGRSTPKKCWSRSFVMNVKAQSETKEVGGESAGQRQRMLTSLVCEDTTTWWAAFRVVE